MSLRAFARGRGVSLFSVQRAIADGRLTSASVGRGWPRPAGHRRPRAGDAGMGGPQPAAAAQRAHGGHGPGDPVRAGAGDVAGAAGPRGGAGIRARPEAARGRVRARGRCAVVGPRRRRPHGACSGVPSRAKARLPHLSSADVTVIDGLIREVLVELAEQSPPRGAAAGRGEPHQRRPPARRRAESDKRRSPTRRPDTISAHDPGGPAMKNPVVTLVKSLADRVTGARTAIGELRAADQALREAHRRGRNRPRPAAQRQAAETGRLAGPRHGTRAARHRVEGPARAGGGVRAERRV